MEESEKRRERLKAMRMNAAQAEVSYNADTSTVPNCLSNPLIELSAVTHLNENSHAVPRFDFYTDPMSAFYGNDRSKDCNQTPQDYFSPPISHGSPMMRLSPSFSAGPMNPNMTPSPTNQFQSTFSPNQRMYQAPSPYHGSGSWRSPIGMVSTFHRQQGTPPGSWNGSGGMASCGFLSNSSRGGGFSSPVYGRGGSPSPNSGRGRGRWFNSSSSPSSGRGGSPSPNSGRVRGRWFNSSPSHGSGQGGGRGQGFHANVSARERPEMFYTKSMVEDPWRLLKPVIRSLVVPAQSLNTPNSLRSWLSKSVSMKKTRISEAANDFSSQSSLAECLASSFEETVKDATSA